VRLGGAEGACRPDEHGPALRVALIGLKDRSGVVRVELYPANDRDFLADDTVLIAAGKTFRRVDAPTPASGPAELCIRAPAPGAYAVAVLHDRDGDGRFNPLHDGVGFPNNPRLGLAKPKAAQVSLKIGPAVTRANVVLNYWNGLSIGPAGSK
jgi:uncharacterized protein (DUF2141 family)